MSKILLDENFGNTSYLKKAIWFVNKYFTGNYVVFHPNKVIRHSPNKRSMEVIIEKQLLASRKLDIYDSDLIIEIDDKIYESLQFSKKFIGKIKYIENDLKQRTIIVLSPQNFKNDKKKMGKTYLVNDIEEELESNIANWIISKEERLIIRMCGIKNRLKTA